MNEERNLIVIFGPPRTGTSFMHRCLIKHPDCAGSKDTNENTLLVIDNTPRENMDVLNTIWKDHVSDEKHLILKSPGYCFAYDMFNKLSGYNCKYIYTYRDPIDAALSKVNHSVSEAVLTMPMTNNGCPANLQGKFSPLWDKTEKMDKDTCMFNRALMRYAWHVEAIDPKMMNQAYDAYNNTWTDLYKFLDIKRSSVMSSELAKFDNKTRVERSEFEDKVMPELKPTIDKLTIKVEKKVEPKVEPRIERKIERKVPKFKSYKMD